MRKVIFFIVIILSIFNYCIDGLNSNGYYFSEKDGEEDVVYFSFEKMEFLIGKQWPDIDISYVEVENNNGLIDFRLNVYGEIVVDPYHRYYFDVDQLSDDYHRKWFTLEFSDGNTSLLFQNNFTLN